MKWQFDISYLKQFLEWEKIRHGQVGRSKNSQKIGYVSCTYVFLTPYTVYTKILPFWSIFSNCFFTGSNFSWQVPWTWICDEFWPMIFLFYLLLGVGRKKCLNSFLCAFKASACEVESTKDGQKMICDALCTQMLWKCTLLSVVLWSFQLGRYKKLATILKK